MYYWLSTHTQFFFEPLTLHDTPRKRIPILRDCGLKIQELSHQFASRIEARDQDALCHNTAPEAKMGRFWQNKESAVLGSSQFAVEGTKAGFR